MSHFWFGFFGALTGLFLALACQAAALSWKRRKSDRRFAECNRHMELAQKATTREAYEFHMEKALELLDNKICGPGLPPRLWRGQAGNL